MKTLIEFYDMSRGKMKLVEMNNGEKWLCQFNKGNGKFVTIRQATEDDLKQIEILKLRSVFNIGPNEMFTGVENE